MKVQEVLKFGGSSLASPDSIDRVLKIIQERYQETRGQVAVVFSAFGRDPDAPAKIMKLTDQLIDLADQAFWGRELEERYANIVSQVGGMQRRLFPPDHSESRKQAIMSTADLTENLKDFVDSCREFAQTMPQVFANPAFREQALDRIISYGELVTNNIVIAYLNQRELPAQLIDPRDIIVTDSQFGRAKIIDDPSCDAARQVFSALPEGTLPVMPGFVAADQEGRTTTLGRNGSDISATFLGKALHPLGVQEIQIWSDVNGLKTADPRKVSKAQTIDRVSFREMKELSHWMTRVLPPRATKPAEDVGVPIRLKNTYDPSAAGTLIDAQGNTEAGPVCALSAIENVSLLSLTGIDFLGAVGTLERFTRTLAEAGVNIIMISQGSSEHTITVAIDPGELQQAQDALHQEFQAELESRAIEEPKVDHNCSVIAIVGDQMKNRPGVSARFLQALAEVNISAKIIAQGGEERNVSVAIQNGNGEALKTAINAVHRAFFEPERTITSLYLVGATGQIGRRLLEMVSSRRQAIAERTGIELNVVGLMNSCEMLIGNQLSPVDWDELEHEEASTERFFQQARQSHRPNPIAVDCTASSEVAEHYPELLRNGLAVVTPNKLANTSSMEDYRELRTANSAPFRYETTVGSALRVIGTIRDILDQGEQISKIEAVASGTLSYLFNHYDGSKAFSQLVREACDGGYTEPHPRDDLNGMDVARKLLTMLREAGHNIELADIEVQSLLPDGAVPSDDPEAFLLQLESLDPVIEENYRRAEVDGKVLRYVAHYEAGRARVGLTSLPRDHAFAQLTGTQNLFLFTREGRDMPDPAAPGPGAGVDWTASGVLTDILKVARSQK